jgi:A/G-specific adenine glycosylase
VTEALRGTIAVMPSLAAAAARWYATAARDLPWRRPGTSAWAVLVSEVMLQQTPVARVLPAWSSWMARWPTPAAMAAAPAGDAVREWGRLGYPRRALRLHECARALTTGHGGEVPDRLEDLLALPGIGAYTARAVAAFAYGQRHPVVDTNVRRLVARAHTGRADGGPSTTTADLALVEALLPAQPARAAVASAALMELGAVVCTARSPACGRCPLAARCAWRQAGQPGAGAGRTTRVQRYAGTDRQARGALLAVARDAAGAVPSAAFEAAWPDSVQRDRALHGLVTDGLLVPLGSDAFALP